MRPVEGSFLPDRLHVVFSNLPVVGQQGKMLDLRLGYEEPVEWIGMQSRKPRSPQRVAQTDRQHAGVDLPQIFGNEAMSWLGEPGGVLGRLHHNLPRAGRTEQKLRGVVLNESARVCGESWIAVDEPKERVRVEQNSHC